MNNLKSFFINNFHNYTKIKKMNYFLPDKKNTISCLFFIIPSIISFYHKHYILSINYFLTSLFSILGDSLCVDKPIFCLLDRWYSTISFIITIYYSRINIVYRIIICILLLSLLNDSRNSKNYKDYNKNHFIWHFALTYISTWNLIHFIEYNNKLSNK